MNGSLGLEAFVKIVLKKRLDKNENDRFSDWEDNRLDENQVRYAALDAWASLLVFEDIRDAPNRTLRVGDIIHSELAPRPLAESGWLQASSQRRKVQVMPKPGLLVDIMPSGRGRNSLPLARAKVVDPNDVAAESICGVKASRSRIPVQLIAVFSESAVIPESEPRQTFYDVFSDVSPIDISNSPIVFIRKARLCPYFTFR